MDLFRAHLKEVERKRKDEEKRIDELRLREMENINKKKEEDQIKAYKAKECLKQVRRN